MKTMIKALFPGAALALLTVFLIGHGLAQDKGTTATGGAVARTTNEPDYYAGAAPAAYVPPVVGQMGTRHAQTAAPSYDEARQVWVCAELRRCRRRGR